MGGYLVLNNKGRGVDICTIAFHCNNHFLESTTIISELRYQQKAQLCRFGGGKPVCKPDFLKRFAMLNKNF